MVWTKRDGDHKTSVIVLLGILNVKPVEPELKVKYAWYTDISVKIREKFTRAYVNDRPSSISA